MEKDLNLINVYLTVDRKTIYSYFNMHDPAPLYKRQLSHIFEEYIRASVANAKRHSVIIYKMKCTNSIDKKYADPLIYAVKNHFCLRKKIREEQFQRFKKRNWILLGLSLLFIIVCQGILPLFFKDQDSAQTVLFTGLDVLSWVILWRPIDTLIFEWNPHLKEISILNKLATSEVVLVESYKEITERHDTILKAVSQTG